MKDVIPINKITYSPQENIEAFKNLADAEAIKMCKALKKTYNLTDGNIPHSISVTERGILRSEFEVDGNLNNNQEAGISSICSIMYLFSLQASDIIEKK